MVIEDDRVITHGRPDDGAAVRTERVQQSVEVGGGQPAGDRRGTAVVVITRSPRPPCANRSSSCVRVASGGGRPPPGPAADGRGELGLRVERGAKRGHRRT